jgi:hypothetical protein
MKNRSSIKAFLVFEAGGAKERFQDDMCQAWLRFLLTLSPRNAEGLRFRIEQALGLSKEVVGRPGAAFGARKYIVDQRRTGRLPIAS